MTDLKAGDKAILDKNITNEIVIYKSPDRNNDDYSIVDIKGIGDTSISNKRLTECHTVRILDNGMAREVNPVGDEPNIDHYKDQVKWSYDHNAWQLAGSECRTLPWKYDIDQRGSILLSHFTVENNPDGKKEIDLTGKEFYAYIENETFILVNPLSK